MRGWLIVRAGWAARIACILVVLSRAAGYEAKAQQSLDDGRAEALDRALQEFVDHVGCTAATVAVGRGDAVIYTNAYGSRNQARTEIGEPDAIMRIASVSKCITAAAVRELVRTTDVSYDTPVFPLLGVQPANGWLGDLRIPSITIGQLLEHKGGWDRTKGVNPLFEIGRIERELGLERPAEPADVIRWMLARPLQFTPGERKAYSNFGYLVLGRAVERASGMSYGDYVQRSLLSPHGITDIYPGSTLQSGRSAREVEYPPEGESLPMEVRDSPGGLVASAPALCAFMAHYWLSGEPRDGSNQQWTFFGSLPGTTAMVCQRPDGLNVAVLLNGRRSTFRQDNQTLKRVVDTALDG